MQAKLKPGLLTSEFLGVVISMAVSTAVMYKVIPAEQATQFTDQTLRLVDLVVQAATALTAVYVAVGPIIAYIKARLELKKTVLQNASSQGSV